MLLKNSFMGKRSNSTILVFVIYFSSGCITDVNKSLEIKGDFNFIEFGGEEIYAIKENKGSILVANEIGLFVKQTKEVSWLGLIEGNVSVRAFEIISEHEIIASLYFNTQDSSTIAKTINYGKDWLSYRNGYDPFLNLILTVI